MHVPSSLLRGLVALSLASLGAFAGDKAPTVGRHKDFHGLDVVEIKEVFKRSDYALVKVVPFDLAPIEIPDAKDNTHEVVLEAKAKFHGRFLDKFASELSSMRVVAEVPAPKVDASAPKPDAPATVEGAAPAVEPAQKEAHEPRTLLVKGVVTKLNPGSAAGRAFFGMFGGGQARIEITCEVIDAASGKVLATLVHARAGAMSGGWGYDRLIQNLNEEIGEDVATLIKIF